MQDQIYNWIETLDFWAIFPLKPSYRWLSNICTDVLLINTFQWKQAGISSLLVQVIFFSMSSDRELIIIGDFDEILQDDLLMVSGVGRQKASLASRSFIPASSTFHRMMMV